MKIQICDVIDCMRQAERVSIPLDNYGDAASSIDRDCDIMDLCGHHMKEMFYFLLSDAELNTRKRASNMFKRKC